MLLPLLLLGFLLPAAAESVKELKKRWRDEGDVVAMQRLIARAERQTRPYGRVEALYALSLGYSRPSPDVGTVIAGQYDRLMDVANKAGQDPDVSVRQAGGQLSQSLQHWMNHDSPGAQAKQAAFRRGERRVVAAYFLGQAAVISLFFVAAGFALATGGGVLWLFFGPTGGAPAAVPAFRLLIRRSPAYLLLLPACSAAAGLALLAVIWRTVSMTVPAFVKESDELIMLYAARALCDWRVILAYVAAAFALTLLHAAFVHGVLVTARRGRAPWLAESLAAVARRLPELLVLGGISYGLQWVLHVGLARWRHKFPPRLRVMADVAAWLAGVKHTFGAAMVAGLIVTENLSLPAALKRAKELLKEGYQSGELLRLGAAATLASRSVGSACMLSLFGGWMGMMLLAAPLMTVFPIYHSTLKAAAFWGLGISAGAACALAVYSLILVAQAVIAAEAILPDPKR